MLQSAWKFITCVILILLIQAHAGAQNDITYVYDESGRLVAVIDPGADTVRYAYDATGNLLSITRQSSASLSLLEFTPNTGPVGTEVTIYGTGFSAVASQNVVKFNGTAATVVSATTTKLVTKVPTAATTGPISVTRSASTATSSTSFVVGNLKSPTITSFTPTIGVPGTAVSITGTNFRTTPTDNFLRFNVTDSLPTSATATTLKATVPTNVGSGRISVTTVFGKGTSNGDFFIPPTPYTPADVQTTGRMEVGTSKSVAISTANKIGLIVFDGVAGQHVTLSLSSVRFSSCRVAIYNPNSTTLATAGVGTNGGLLDAPVLPVDGTYTILVDPDGNYTGSLMVGMNEAGDVLGTITPGGPALTLATTAPGQNARATFTGTAGQRVSLR
ncbi:MAG TPA: IPT/TIG domain-containing protein, partial [Pyrinomonadaceae bacterium]